MDIGLPDKNGIELCKHIRSKCINTPIIMLTGVDDTKHKVEALNSGADDYVTKPFHMEELSARVTAVLRRPQNMVKKILSVDDLVLDLSNHRVTRDGKVIDLRRKEYDLLEYFMRNQSRVLTRDMICRSVWDDPANTFSNTVDVHIKSLRDKVDSPFSKKLIHTVSGIGYKIDIIN